MCYPKYIVLGNLLPYKMKPTNLYKMCNSHLRLNSNWILLATLILNIICTICADPTSQQEQELLLLDALSKRLPSSSTSGSLLLNTNSLNSYGSSNTIMDMLGRSN